MFEYGPKIQACTTVGAVCDLLDEALATLPGKTGGGASGKPAPEPAFEKGQHVKCRGSVRECPVSDRRLVPFDGGR